MRRSAEGSLDSAGEAGEPLARGGVGGDRSHRLTGTLCRGEALGLGQCGHGCAQRRGEAAVVGVPHERWQERPVAFIVVADGVDRDELVERIETGLREEYPKWWVPDAVEFIDEVPKTATGKFSKKDLREQYGDQSLVEGAVPEDDAPEQE